MSFITGIAPQLPFLRRYARILHGSQARGDAAVADVLEALLSDSSRLDASLPVRVACYKAFHDSCPTLDETPASARSHQTLAGLMPRSRQAFVLSAVEGFSRDECATILRTDDAEIERLLVRAGEDIAEQVATDVLIIEDEPIIAMDLETVVESLGHSVIGVARTHREALQLVAGRRPGLLLTDVQLADGSSGVEAVNEILRGFAVPVVFVTAYPERLLSGERPEPTFLITKPFQADHVQAVISQTLFFEAAGTA